MVGVWLYYSLYFLTNGIVLGIVFGARIPAGGIIMTRMLVGIFIAALVVGCSSKQQAADTVYTNGKIYTVNKAQPWAEAVAIKDSKFLIVGSTDDIAAAIGDSTEVMDLAGKFVMPGLVDTHVHPFDSAVSQLAELVFDPVPISLDDIQQQVADYIQSHPDPADWRASNIPKGIFPGENYMREDLDAVVSDRPFCILDQGGHAYWCNTFALEKTGIMDPDYQIAEYGVVERDEKGVPTGTVREMTVGEVNRMFYKVSEEINIEAAKFVMKLFNSKGVTALRTADGSQDHARALKTLADKGELTAHWALSYDVNYLASTYSHAENMEQIAERKQYASGRVSIIQMPPRPT